LVAEMLVLGAHEGSECARQVPLLSTAEYRTFFAPGATIVESNFPKIEAIRGLGF
jgi:hypothetical protein